MTLLSPMFSDFNFSRLSIRSKKVAEFISIILEFGFNLLTLSKYPFVMIK